MKLAILNTTPAKIAIHTTAWVIVFSLPYLLRPSYEQANQRLPPANAIFWLTFLTGFFWVGVFYLNAYLLTPLFIYKRKYGIYTISLLAIYGVTMVLHGLLFKLLITERPFNFLRSASFNFTAFVLTVVASITYKMINDKAETDRITSDTQQENLKTELSFLRSQISPHFIFNVLNNMVALVRKKSDQLEPTIMKLSSLMQYMLYETDEEKVLLKSEAEYLQGYIDLQQQRFGAKVKLNVSIDVNDTGNLIEPMLMIPFVENAFKHGVGMIEKPEIDIDLHKQSNTVFFTVCNKYNEKGNEIKDKTSGIGLVNVTRRLNLLYPDQHQLLITKNEGVFSVSLQLNLH